MDEIVEESNPLLFYVAYKIGEDGKYYYMGDGKGNIRLFKTQDGLDEYLAAVLMPAQRSEVVTHTVQGMIAVPEAEKQYGTLVPMTTLAPNTLPTAQEMLREWNRRRKGGKR